MFAGSTHIRMISFVCAGEWVTSGVARGKVFINTSAVIDVIEMG